MKKLFIPVALVLSLASCKKAYTCSCSTVYTYDDGAGYSTETWADDDKVYSAKMSKKAATAACDAEKASLEKSFNNAITDNGQYTLGAGESIVSSCTLK